MTTLTVPTYDEQENWYAEQALNSAIIDEIRFWRYHAHESITDYSVPRNKAWTFGRLRYHFWIEQYQIGLERKWHAKMRDDYGYGCSATGFSAKQAYRAMFHYARLSQAIANWKYDKHGQRITFDQ